MGSIAKFVREPRTDADVQLLLHTFVDLLPDGRLITHEAIEAALKMQRHAARYRTVTKHWRRILFQEQRVFLDGRSAEGHGFKVLTADEMVRYANREVRAVGRRLKRALLVAATPTDNDIVDVNTRVYRSRLLSGAEQIATAHGRVMKELGSALRAPRQLPRAAPGR